MTANAAPAPPDGLVVPLERLCRLSWPTRDGQEGEEIFAALGYRDARLASSWLDRMSREPAFLRLGATEQDHLERLLPVVVTAAGACQAPDTTLRLSLDLFERLGRWPGYYAFLLAHPDLLRRLVLLLGASPCLGRFITLRPALIDEWLSGSYLDGLPEPASLRSALAADLARCADDETRLLEALCEFKQCQLLRIVTLDLAGAIGLDDTSRALSDLADLLLETVLRSVAERLGHGAQPPLGIVGYGKLGSREMSYASDTDIVFIFDEEAGLAPEALTRLAHTVNRWLTLPTAAGVLYETDFQLRPYGRSGALVTGSAAFRDYQLRHAQVWEHQALTRARWIAGDERLREAFGSVRQTVLRRERDADHLRTELVAMRARIAAAHGMDHPLFDVKHGRGGIIDAEFAVQHTILRYAAVHPELACHDDNTGTLGRVAALGIVPLAVADAAGAAYRRYRDWLHRGRLHGSETVRVSEVEAQPHREAILALWRATIERDAPVSVNR